VRTSKVVSSFSLLLASAWSLATDYAQLSADLEHGSDPVSVAKNIASDPAADASLVASARQVLDSPAATEARRSRH